MAEDNEDDASTVVDETLRRRFLQGAGAAGIASIAGCGGRQARADRETTTKPPATTHTGTVEEEGKPVDPALSLAQWAVPKDSQYNPYNGKNYAEPRRMLYDGFIQYNLATQEFTPYAISDWNFADDNTMTLTVREGLKWHNGDDVTAQDLKTQLQLDMYTGGTLGDYVSNIAEDVTKTGERTVEVSFEPVNRRIVMGLIQPKSLAAKYEVYKEYLQGFHDATTEKERSQVLADLTSFTLKEPVGNGPFQFEGADAQRTLLTQFEDHPDADNINYPRAEYLYGPSNQKRWSMLINGVTDGSATLFMPQNKLRQLPDYVRVGHIPRHWGLGLIFNWDNKHFQKEKVRQAFAHVIKREVVAANSGAGTNTKIAVDIPSGLTGQFSGAIKDKWLQGIADSFNHYKPDTDRAAQLLREAGYEKVGGTWQEKSTGETLKAPIKCPAGFSDWVAGARTMVAHLDQFGIDATLLTLDTATYWGKAYAQGNFQLALQGWASYSRIYPYFHFQWLYAGSNSEDIWGVPKTFDVPPVAQPDGPTSTVKPDQIVDELSTVSSDEALNKIQKLAWVTNQKLPVLPIQEKLAQTFMTADDWQVPPRDSKKIQTYWPTEWGPRRGWWYAETK